jgi:hypothetical protein
VLAASGVVIDPTQHVGWPGLPVDVVEPGGLDHGGDALAAAAGAGEGPIAPAVGNVP